MEVAVPQHPATLTLGPTLFNWQPERWRDFYVRIAEEAPVDLVYLGEVVCAKRAPLFAPYFPEVAERLAAAGKSIVFSTLAEVVLKYDRQLVEQICAAEDTLVEANDGSALLHLRGRPHHVGPFVNVYNERTAAFLARGGARNFCLPVEMPAAAIHALCEGTRDLDATIEVQVFGRVPLALSARCYHARAHGRTKDSCQFVCDNDPEGLELDTLDGRPFLAVNGIQTLEPLAKPFCVWWALELGCFGCEP
jgi:collagenase-like PrtC family protease